jgi:hypothetical protein
MRELPYIVECNMGRFWEPIAAFNSVTIARGYAADCAEGATRAYAAGAAAGNNARFDRPVGSGGGPLRLS